MKEGTLTIKMCAKKPVEMGEDSLHLLSLPSVMMVITTQAMDAMLIAMLKKATNVQVALLSMPISAKRYVVTARNLVWLNVTMVTTTTVMDVAKTVLLNMAMIAQVEALPTKTPVQNYVTMASILDLLIAMMETNSISMGVQKTAKLLMVGTAKEDPPRNLILALSIAEMV